MQPNGPYQQNPYDQQQQGQNPYTNQPLGPNPYVQQQQMQQRSSVPYVMPKSDRPLGLIVSLGISVVFLLGAIGFGAWAYMSRQDYKDNTDAKVSAAVDKAVADEDAKKDAEFVEAEKKPYKTYSGPNTYGSINFSYPKTWSAFVTEQGSSPNLDGYFHPGIVPGLNSGTGIALHMQVVERAYDSEVKAWNNKVKSNKVKVSAYKATLMQAVTGSRVEGEIETGMKGVMILFPLRDKTIEISTLSPDYIKDFDSIVMASFTFEP